MTVQARMMDRCMCVGVGVCRGGLEVRGRLDWQVCFYAGVCCAGNRVFKGKRGEEKRKERCVFNKSSGVGKNGR